MVHDDIIFHIWPFFRLSLKRVSEEVFHRFQLLGSGEPMLCWTHLEILSSWFLQSQEGESEAMDIVKNFQSHLEQSKLSLFLKNNFL